MARPPRTTLLAILSGLLFALSLPPHALSILAWLGFIPLGIALTDPALGWQRAARLGLITGLVYFGISMRWYFSVDAAQVAGIKSRLAGFLTVSAVWAWSTIAMAVAWALFAIGIWWLLRKLSQKPWLIALSSGCLFAVTEYLRSFIFELAWWGPGTTWGAHWTLVSPVYAFADNQILLWLVSFIGTYGLAMLLGMVGIAGTLIIQKNYWRQRKAIVLVIIFFSSIYGTPWLLPKHQYAGRTIPFALAQTDEPTEFELTEKDNLKIFNRQLELIRAIAKQAPQTEIIALPETSDFLRYLSIFMSPTEIQRYFQKLFGHPITVVASIRIQNENKYYSRVIFLNSERGLLGYYDKHILTPNGEYIPYITRPLVRLFDKNLTAKFQTIREYSPGPFPGKTPIYTGRFNITAAICSDFASTAVIRELAKQTDVIVGLASISGFRSNGALLEQNLALNRTRAAENGTPILMVINQGISYAINGDGSVAKIATGVGQKLLTGNLYERQDKSWYNVIGNWILLPFFIVVLGTIAVTLRRDKYTNILQ